jgi:hypothetical protein
MDDKTDLLAIIEEDLRRHPRAGPKDLCKLVAQSVLGGDHLLGDAVRFRRALRSEWDALPSGPRRAAIQPIDPDGRTARIHLAPCREAGIDPECLADLLLSQPRKAGTREAFAARWREVIELAGDGRIPFDPTSLAEFEALAEMPHHSDAYGLAAYRVLNDITDPAVAGRLRAWRLLA